ncbi:Histidine kinase-like ATPase domain-containing protein [Streptomyces sp. DvalAA-14]|uniref:SpoIIE family protein phosphatase n=1 Tax=unclassified Streptomyces TaxID=2593676 RepID=UPI00081B8C03|nr:MULTISPECIES: SpoIIE family protein phosphatase [unclassified Streptomyces]MYS22320.1 SpoIIE family protein phosphatase [Streptomyces sp. SID4948]SCE13841.1 Histidine kinase-like ATPase domain-containing protein [Streptomyces sp. DvalAA-14]
MSASEPRDSRDGTSPTVYRYGNPAVPPLLSAAVGDAVDELGGVICTVYFLDEAKAELRAAMIGGTSPAMHAIPERLPLDSSYPSAEAFRTDRPVIKKGSYVPHEGDDLAAFLSSYCVSAAPITHEGRRFGVMSLVVRSAPGTTPASARAQQWLARRARDLARALAPVAEQGLDIGPPPWPTVVPLHRQQPGLGEWEVPGWGLPDAPGSAGHTFMYQVFKLNGSLNRALTRDQVTATAEQHLMIPFKAQEMALTRVEDSRLWVAGHSGRQSPGTAALHGSGIDGRTPTAEVLSRGTPLFYGDRAGKLADYPDAPADDWESAAYLPLKGSRGDIGVCCLGFGAPRRFAPEERAVMMVMAGMLGAALERVCLEESEHKLAQSLQKRLLPRTLSELPELVVAARYLPAVSTSMSGGDWFDVVRLPDERIALIVGDVEGHSVESATVMGQVRTSVLAYVREGHPPAAVLERAGKLLADMDTDLFATCCVMFLDGTSGVATSCLAGHPPPVTCGPHGVDGPLDARPGAPLGVQPDTPYQDFETTLDPGTLLLLYTDGLADGSSLDAESCAEQQLDMVGRDGTQNLEKSADQVVGGLAPPDTRRDDAVLLLARYEGPRLGASRRLSRLDIQRHDLQGVAAARRFVRSQLESWDYDLSADTLELIVSELATNALIHADSDVQLRLREFADHIGLEVIDSDTTPPVPSFMVVSEEEGRNFEHGRGLVIVDALVSAFGSSPNGRGKTVWVEVATN